MQPERDFRRSATWKADGSSCEHWTAIDFKRMSATIQSHMQGMDYQVRELSSIGVQLWKLHHGMPSLIV